MSDAASTPSTSLSDSPIEVGATHRADVVARRWRWAVAVTLLYAAIVITAAVYHEPWRDEVVALSIARGAFSLPELAAALKYEGHPILWYLVLREAYALVGQTWVIKAVSLASAIGAIFLFVYYCPLPWWLRILFTFSVFPLYHYSVVSVGYSLEMLLLFAFCTLHPHRREYPLAIAVVLAALANTEFLGFIIAVAAAVSLLFEDAWWGSGWRRWVRDRHLVFAAAIYLAGLLLAYAVAFPDPGSPAAIGPLNIGRIAAGMGGAIVWPAGHARRLSFILPMLSVWVWAYFVYLTRRPALLCFAATALIGIEASFTLVYAPAPWHLGNLLLVLIATMWLDASGSTPTATLSPHLERARSWLGPLVAGGMAVLLAEHVFLGVLLVANDLGHDFSSSRRLGELLRGDPALACAVVIGEPDSWVTSLPYYADNPLYLPREDVYRWWGRPSPARRSTYDLDALLAAARDVRTRCKCPVVIVMGWELQRAGLHTVYKGSPVEETFAITPEARAAFLAATRRIASLHGEETFPWLEDNQLRVTTNEQYDVYLLR